MTSPAIDILEAATDPELFKGWFRDPTTWRTWFCFLRSMFRLPMTEEDRSLFRHCTGRDDRPAGGFTEAWLVVGRRGRKSIMLALVAVFLACFIDWSTFLNRGERGVVLVVAADKKQARVIFGGEWPRERMRLQGVAYELAKKPKSDLYSDALPALNSGKIELLDHPRLVSQICSLERRTARGGGDSIDHPPGASSHDDIANAALAALLLVGLGPPPVNMSDETIAALRMMRPWRSEFAY